MRHRKLWMAEDKVDMDWERSSRKNTTDLFGGRWKMKWRMYRSDGREEAYRRGGFEITGGLAERSINRG